jgi:hypothetical protein
MGKRTFAVLSIRQPYAWLVANSGRLPVPKDVENRKWSTEYRGLILFHASKTRDKEAWAAAQAVAVEQGVVLPEPDALVRGCIVGGGRLVDCVDHYDSPWWVGPYGLVLRECKPLVPIPARGELGVFSLTVDTKELREDTTPLPVAPGPEVVPWEPWKCEQPGLWPSNDKGRRNAGITGRKERSE